MTTTLIDAPGARLHYRLDGPVDSPLVILANSLGTTLTMWDGQITALTRSFRVLRFDMRGHGASSVSGEPGDVPRLGRDGLLLMDRVQATPALFLGLSLGGMVGLWLGVHAPQRLEKLVLSNTAAVIGSRLGWNARIDLVARDGMEGVADAVIGVWVTHEFHARKPASVERLRQMLLSTSRAGYIAGCAAVRDTDLTGSVASVRVPTLIITGEFDSVTPPSAGRWLAEKIEGAEVVELEAAHLSNIEAESGFNERLLGFLTG